MNPDTEPRRARTEFEWHLRGILIDTAALITAVTLASIACVVTFFLFTQVPVLMTTTMAAAFSPPGHSATIPVWAAAAVMIGGVITGAGVGLQVFSKVSRVADEFFGRFALLPPPLTDER